MNYLPDIDTEPSPAGASHADDSATGKGIQPLRCLVVALWVVVVAAGTWMIAAYKSRPGDAGRTPESLPAEARGDVAQGLPRLLMFVHPRCPCSRASVAEFAEILARHPGAVAAEVLFVHPDGVDAEWERSDLWSAACALPGVRARCDDGGRLAQRFGARTSGHVVLYDAGGRLLFSGGITRSRGHEGESTGRRTVCTLLSGQFAEERHAPVFGCPLFAPGASCAAGKSCPRIESVRLP